MIQPLEGTRVLELATGVAGPFVGKLLADFGAEVVKVEPSGGDPARLHGPFPDDVPDLEQSALFLHLNTNKRSIVLDPKKDRDVLARLIAESDVVIESFAPGYLDGLGLGYEEMKRLNPAVVLTSVTPFGQSGPYADLVSSDIVTYAMGGPMFGTGVEDREPVKLGGNLTSYQAGNVAATATLSALLLADQSGESVHIDLSMFEAQAGSVDRRVTYLLWHLWTGRVVGRQAPGAVRQLPNSFFETLEGHVLVFTLLPWVPRMLEVLDDAGLRERFAQPDWLHDEELPDEIMSVLIPWLFEGDKSDRSRLAQAEKWAMTPLNPPVDLIDDPHFTDRGFFHLIDHPAAGSFRIPGAPFRLGDEWDRAWQIRRPAPLLNEHSEEVRAELEAEAELEGGAELPTTRGGSQRAEGERALPLEGIRVLDMTVVWAGPSCTMHLADLGAEVIRVDNPFVFPPATRGNAPRPAEDLLVDFGPLGGGYPNLDVSGRPWNKHGMWAAQARNKLSCTLDIRKPEGLDAFFRLVDECDLLVENNSVHTLDKLGIGWAALQARNPKLICLRMPPMSLAGPYSEYVGFGASFEALCGLTRVRGYTDDDPTTTSAAFHMDPASGASAAFAAMCALRLREESGVGQLIEFAQGENMMHHVGEYFVDADRTGRSHGPGGNRHISRAPQGCYRCAGDDRWVVISVGSDAEWAGLCQAMDRLDLVTDERFSNLATRLANHDELDQIIEAWTVGLDHRSVFERCQAERVPAGPVLDEADAYADPHLNARGFFRPQGSEDIGTWDFPGQQWTWDGPDMRWESICRLGADNEYVLKELLGMTEDEYAALDAAGHISLDYHQPDGTPF